MKISPESEKFADTICFNRFREIYEEGRKELLNRKFISHEETEQADFSIRMNAAAKMIEEKLKSYITVYEKEGKLIDDEDRNEIFEKINRIISIQCQQVFSATGTIAILRNQWSDTRLSQMKEYFENKVKVLAEPALNSFILKIQEMKLNKMLEQNKDKQYEVLRWIYDKADGRQYDRVYLLELIKDNSNYTNGELEKISDYLSGEGLIVQDDDSGMLVHLTHKGIVEIQNSISNPQKATEHFPAQVTYNFNAPVGSVQQGNQNIANVQQNFGAKAEEVVSLLKELRKHISDENKQEGLEYIERLETEIKSEKPSESTIKLFLKGLGGIVKDTGKELLIDVGKKVVTGEIQLG